MDIKPDDIKRYLEGKTTSEESAQIKEWLVNPQNDAVSRSLMGNLWANSDIQLKGNKPDTDRMLQKTRFRIYSSVPKKTSPKITAPGTRLIQIFSRVAAVLIIPLLAFTAYLYFQRLNDYAGTAENITPNIREVYTKPGTKTHFLLADGTMVWLNDGTTFRYPETFNGNTREVFVDGEAYFEVKADKHHPFIVNNPMMNTVVTGTHFNINGYSSDNFFEATLLEGKIHLESKSGNVELAPGQQLQFDTNARKMVQRELKNKNVIGWIDGKLIIQNESLEVALKKISRWYNVEIQVVDQSLNNYELTCTLENEKLEQCMSLISNALPVRYTIEERNNRKKVLLEKI
jgi:ferric-dicitrate binding protein FerR (iron transport regulator)